MTTGNDKDLQRFVDGDHPVAAAYRKLPQASPPAHLDDAILAAARSEARRPVRPRWLVPVSVAATVVLGVGLSIRQINQPMSTVSDMSAPAASMEMASDQGAPQATRRQSGRDAEPVPKPSVEALLKTAPLDAVAMEKSSVDVDALRERALADTARFEPPSVETLTRQMDASEPPAARDETYAAAPPAAKRIDAANAQRGAARDIDSIEAAPAGQLPREPQTDVYSDASVATAPLIAGDDAEETVRLPQAREDHLAMSEATMSMRQRARPEAEFSVSMSMSHAPLDERAIEQRLELIETLHRRGETEMAQVLFDELIEAFPDYEVPEDFPLQRPELEPQAPPPP
jgi:hypothetical protein